MLLNDVQVRFVFSKQSLRNLWPTWFDAWIDFLLVSAVMDDLTGMRAAEELSHQGASLASLVRETDAAPAQLQPGSSHNLADAAELEVCPFGL